MVQLAFDFKWCSSWVSAKVNTAPPAQSDRHTLTPFVADTKQQEAWNGGV